MTIDHQGGQARTGAARSTKSFDLEGQIPSAGIPLHAKGRASHCRDDTSGGSAPAIRPLPLKLVPGGCELPVDYLSRLSFRNGRDGLRRICKDFGIDLASLLRGEAEAVGAVAGLGGMDPSIMIAAAPRLLGDRSKISFRGQVFQQPMTNDRRVRFCAACLREDIEGGKGRVECRPWRRGEWLVRDIATCPVHWSALVELDGRLVDFSRAIVDVIPNLADLERSVESRSLTGLERYILDRLSKSPAGTGSESWLDGMPLYAAIRFCEVLGTVALEGIHAPGKRGHDLTLRPRLAAGFEIASAGRDEFQRFLADLQRGRPRIKSKYGPLAFFGPIYESFANHPRDPAYDPIRHAIRDHWLETNAVGPEDLDPPFGWPVAKRRLHSVISASKAFGIHPSPLRNALFASGIVGPDQRDLTHDAVTFHATAHESFIRDLSSTLTRAAAAAYLGMPKHAFLTFIEAGLIAPWLGGAGTSVKNRFRKADLDAFVASLLARVSVSNMDDGSLLDIATAARRVKRRPAVIVELLISHKLQRVGHRTGMAGYGSVLVDLGEIMDRLGAPDGAGLTATDASTATGISPQVLRLLAREGLVRSRTGWNPVIRARSLLLDRDDLARFCDEYVVLSKLASERGSSWLMVKRCLSEAGIAPVAFSDKVGAVFYARKALAHLTGVGFAPCHDTKSA